MVPVVFTELKYLNALFREWYFAQKSENPKPFFPNSFFPTVIIPKIKNLKMLLYEELQWRILYMLYFILITKIHLLLYILID